MEEISKNDARPRCFSYIRFSTPEQMSGDSLRRQVDMSEAYAKEHGHELDTTLNLNDLGTSAYTGEHRTKGALRTFLDAIDSGFVPPGSILLVESLDRLSREQVLDALELFKNILKKEIKIVTLTDNREYTYDSINDDPMSLIFSLLVYVRANEESKIKSQRLSEAWKRKRAQASIIPLTSVCPSWLRLNDKTKRFEIVDERGQLIRTIFALYLDGYGKRKIERHLNEKKVPTWGGGKGWHSSYITKILNNRAVIGEFQPHTTKNGKRTPVGEPICDYYPATISEDTFFQAQNRIKAITPKGGRTGKVNNLFSGIAICGYCNAPMHYVAKGPPPKGHQYLICSNANRGVGCKRILFRYENFEVPFLLLCKQLNLTEIFPDNNRKHFYSEITTLRSNIESLEGQLKDIKKKNANLLCSLEGTPEPNVQQLIVKQLNSNDHDIQRIEKEQSIVNNELNIKLGILSDTQHQIQDIKQIVQQLTSASNDARVDLRLKLRTHIRNIVSKVYIYPAGPTINEDTFRIIKSKCNRVVRRMLDGTDHDQNDIAEIEHRIIQRYSDNLLDNKNEKTRQHSQLSIIEFKSGVYNTFSSRRDDPSNFILRTHNDLKGLKHGDYLDFQDSIGDEDWWHIIQDIYGMQFEVVLASEVSKWEHSKQK